MKAKQKINWKLALAYLAIACLAVPAAGCMVLEAADRAYEHRPRPSLDELHQWCKGGEQGACEAYDDIIYNKVQHG